MLHCIWGRLCPLASKSTLMNDIWRVIRDIHIYTYTEVYISLLGSAILKCSWWEQLLGLQCWRTCQWKVFPLTQCNNLLNISEGQFHALFPRLLGHPQKNSSLQMLHWMMMHVLKWCKRGSLPQALFPIPDTGIQSYILNRNPNEWCIISSIWSLLWPCS